MADNNTILINRISLPKKYISIDEISDKDLNILNSKKGIKHLIRKNNININTINDALQQIDYRNKLTQLQIQLLKMQKHIINNNKRLIILCEGRDYAGKNGAIRSFMEHMNPRNCELVALPKPSEDDEKSWYFQRYVEKLPKSANITFFDRSWYNRAIVEPVNGFCTAEQYEIFMEEVVQFENMLLSDGVMLIKFYFSITKKEQEKRLAFVRKDPLQHWRLSPVDERAIELWDKYTLYKDEMFKRTSFNNNPWIIIKSDNEMEARLNSIEYTISKIDYD